MARLKNIIMMLAQLVGILVSLCTASSYTPNVIIITADDIGHHDFEFTHKGEGDAKTPYLYQHVRSSDSVVLQNYYVMPNGHSSRSALLTGKHPAILGTQFEVGDATKPYGLDTDEMILPQYLKELGEGYQNHAVGQWDLGFYATDMLPTNRGYDSFYGSYLSYGDYGTHSGRDQAGHQGFDLHNNMELDFTEQNSFKTELYGRKAVNIIKDHDIAKPLHLYVAFQSAQIENLNPCNATGRPIIPNDYYRPFESIEDQTRKCYLALVKAVDEQYGKIMFELENKGMLANSIVIFTTTSGGPAAGKRHFNAASNYPYRGAKLTGWEGAVKGVAVIHTDRTLSQISNCLFHVTDWIPTLVSLFKSAKGLTEPLAVLPSSELYGRDQFNCVFQNGDNARHNIIHFIYGDSISVMKHQYKLVVNRGGFLEQMDEWYSITSSHRNVCGQQGRTCRPTQRACLFDIDDDPCEMRNIADLPGNEAVYRNMMDDVRKFNQSVKYTEPLVSDEQGDPVNFDKSWQSWITSGGSATTTSFATLIMVILIQFIRSC